MLKSKNTILYEQLNISILEGGGLYDLEAVVQELKKFNDGFDTHSMNENTLYLEGQKDMLNKIIVYLEKVL